MTTTAALRLRVDYIPDAEPLHDLLLCIIPGG
jgi:hypothetical protein